MEVDDNDSIVFEQNDLFYSSPFLEEFRRQGKFCDVTLKVDGQSFKAHKIILSATIPYFHAMFTVDMVESTNSEVTLQEIDAETLGSILNFSYSGKITIDTRTVYSLLFGAAYLQVTQIKDKCEEFLIQRLEESSVLGLSKMADALNCSSLVEACKEFIEENFAEVSLYDEFLNLSFKEMIDILDNDDLNVSSEEQVFEALIRWVKKDPISRKEHLPYLLNKVRLALLNVDYLVDNLCKEEFIKSSTECRQMLHKCAWVKLVICDQNYRDLIHKVKDYHLMRQRREFLTESLKTEPRSCKSLSGLIFAVSAEPEQPRQNVETYDPMVSKWFLSEPMNPVCSRMAVAVLEKHVIVIGGYRAENWLNTVQAFDVVSKQWLGISPMSVKRSGAGAAVLKDKLYVCGGFNGTQSLYSVEYYDLDLKVWKFVKPMSYIRTSCGVVALNGYLYALGGHDGATVLDEVERYDPNTNQWTDIAPMLTKRCRLGAASLNGKLYACGGHDGYFPLKTMEMYNPIDNTWQMVAPMNTKRSRVTLITTKGKLWAIGGYDGKSQLSTVEVYNPKLDEWTFGPSMNALKGEVRVGVVPLFS